MTCSWLEPGQKPKPCGKPAEWAFARVYEGAQPEYRCKRHAPRDTSLWTRLVPE